MPCATHSVQQRGTCQPPEQTAPRHSPTLASARTLLPKRSAGRPELCLVKPISERQHTPQWLRLLSLSHFISSRSADALGFPPAEPGRKQLLVSKSHFSCNVLEGSVKSKPTHSSCGLVTTAALRFFCMGNFLFPSETATVLCFCKWLAHSAPEMETL